VLGITDVRVIDVAADCAFPFVQSHHLDELQSFSNPIYLKTTVNREAFVRLWRLKRLSKKGYRESTRRRLFFPLSLVLFGAFCATEKVFFSIDHGAVGRKFAGVLGNFNVTELASYKLWFHSFITFSSLCFL
jgi:hypothetical protein